MLVAGATAGHIYPALSVAAAFRRQPSPPRLLFVAGDDVQSRRLLSEEGEQVVAVAGSAIKRAGLAGFVGAAVRTSLAFVDARRMLARERAALVIGFGSYVSGGVLLAARTLGIPTAIHEANVCPGLANRWLRHVADRVYLGFAEADRAFPRSTILVTGTPVRPAITALVPAEGLRNPARACVLVTSSSRGEEWLRHAVTRMMVTVARRGVSADIHWAFGGEDMASAYSHADVAVVRGGAGTLAELAVAGIPSVIVPLGDASDDHQTANARAVAATGGAMWVSEASWSDEDVAAWIAALVQDPATWRAASAAARTLARPDAAARLVADVMTLMDRGAGLPAPRSPEGKGPRDK